MHSIVATVRVPQCPITSVIKARADETSDGSSVARSKPDRWGKLVAGQIATVPCPKCRARCKLDFMNRTVTSFDGPFKEMKEY